MPVIKKANTLKKEIRVKRFFSEKEIELCEKSNIKMLFSDKKEIVIDEEMTERILPLRTPIVFVFGIFEYTDKLYTELYLHQYLKSNGIKTKSILSRINEIDIEDCYFFPEFMYNKYSDSKKVIMFNHYVRKLELQSNPDVILIGIPGEIMPLDEKHFGHFGIIPYLISNAVKIPKQYRDCSFLLPPLNMSTHNFLILFMEIENIFGVKISDSYIENMEITTYNNLLKAIDCCIKNVNN